MTAARETWDVFCRVVDHYGDVGIALRLARQLAAGAQRDVRLVVDGLASLSRIAPAVDATRDRQDVDGIAIVAWSALAGRPAADVVVELLGCGLPEAYLDAMQARGSVWIDFEHLSAEAWVDGFHGLPSPQPARPLVKHFFYPGFGPRTGGLLVEPGLAERRRAFVDDADAVASFRHRLGLSTGGRQASLFAYADAPVAELFDVLAEDRAGGWSVALPQGVLVEVVDRWFAARGVPAARSRKHGMLTVTTIPFVAQDDYDRLLWSSDVNFVRGEDSFVRAQVAARPSVWSPYRQADDVHLDKLAAFEARRAAAMTAEASAAQHAFARAWNGRGADVASAARAWLEVLPALRDHAGRWAKALAAEAPLVERLVAFVADRRVSP